MSTIIQDFLLSDSTKIEQIIVDYPKQIPVPIVADLMGMHENSLRAALECGMLGVSWRKQGKVNHGYCIPTGKFVRWWLNMKEGN